MDMRQVLVTYMAIVIMVCAKVQKSIYVSDSLQTWNTADNDTNCTMATFDEVGKEISFSSSSDTFWMTSESMILQWIHMEGCFIHNGSFDSEDSENFSTIENCFQFCGNERVGISEGNCVCTKSLRSNTACHGDKCLQDHQLFCGIKTATNNGLRCVCHYTLLSLNVRDKDDEDKNCVSCKLNSSGCNLFAKKCSDELSPLCINLKSSKKSGHIPRDSHNWPNAGLICFENNKQFYNPESYEGNLTWIQGKPWGRKYWVSIFRRKINKHTAISKHFYDFLRCPALITTNGRLSKVLRKCTRKWPSLCIGNGDDDTVPVENVTYMSSSYDDPTYTTNNHDFSGSKTEQQGSGNSTSFSLYTVVGIVAGNSAVIFTAIIAIIIVCKRKKNLKSKAQKGKQLRTYHTAQEQNNGDFLELHMTNFQNNREDVNYRTQVTNILREPNSDSVAAIRAAKGTNEESRGRTPQAQGYQDVSNEDLNHQTISTNTFGKPKDFRITEMESYDFDSLAVTGYEGRLDRTLQLQGQSDGLLKMILKTYLGL